MASPFVKSLLDAAKTEVNSPAGQAAITQYATDLESAAIPAIENAIKNVPKPGGLAGVAIAAVESGLLAELSAVVAKYTSAQVTTFITTEIDDGLNALGA
jgi:hypothetical protein